jgi:hypothetical protein
MVIGEIGSKRNQKSRREKLRGHFLTGKSVKSKPDIAEMKPWVQGLLNPQRIIPMQNTMVCIGFVRVAVWAGIIVGPVIAYTAAIMPRRSG